MCGIAGIVGQGNRRQRDDAVLRMTNSIAHRGPDGEGFYRGDNASLGHRRLAIIDPALGKQPISNEQGTLWLTFNGEIYNYQELRDQLISQGFEFKTNSDSEVIVYAYQAWGPQCVERFRGMFAFALVDLDKQRCMLARDQLGIKPLYYHVSDQGVAFASELRSLLQAFDSCPEVSPRGIEFFLRYRYIPQPDTAYKSIYKLPPATYHVYDFHGRLLEEREYWQLQWQVDRSRSKQEWLEAFEEVLADSIRAHLVADVPFGAFLSGGIDSTLVVAGMSRLLNQQVTAYTIGFDEADYSEYEFARQAAEQLGVNLKHEVVRPNIAQAIEKLLTNYGEPFADTSALPTWCVSELARRDVPMILSGDGADEAFAGYHRYDRWLGDSVVADLKAFLKYPKRIVRRLASAVQQGLSHSRVARWEQHFVGVLNERKRHQLWRPEFAHLVSEPNPAFQLAAAEASRLDRLSFAQHVDIKTYLPGDILTKVDIASMQHGLEVRTPFTDIRVMEFAATLPRDEKVHGKTQRITKALPKRSLRKNFDDQFVNRNKMGFAIPEAGWMRKGSAVRGCFDDLLASDSTLHDFLDQPTLEKMVSDFDDRGVHATSLWSVFSLAFWLNNNASFSRLKQAA